MYVDYAVAVGWYLRSAEQGLDIAQNCMGTIFRNGLGVGLDTVEAVRWYKLAAVQGFGFAQYNLGEQYSKGEGVIQDHVTACAWYSAAAAQGILDAQSRWEECAKLLVDDEVEEAVNLSEEYRRRFVVPFQCSMVVTD